MVLLLDVLQVDALNDHGWVFGLQVGIGTKPSNLSDFLFFDADTGDRPKPRGVGCARIMKTTDSADAFSPLEMPRPDKHHPGDPP